MSYLKDTIDRILGSSLRCLLPSYWWKRIFGLLVDEIDGKASRTVEDKVRVNAAYISNLRSRVSELENKEEEDVVPHILLYVPLTLINGVPQWDDAKYTALNAASVAKLTNATLVGKEGYTIQLAGVYPGGLIHFLHVDRMYCTLEGKLIVLSSPLFGEDTPDYAIPTLHVVFSVDGSVQTTNMNALGDDVIYTPRVLFLTPQTYETKKANKMIYDKFVAGDLIPFMAYGQGARSAGAVPSIVEYSNGRLLFLFVLHGLKNGEVTTMKDIYELKADGSVELASDVADMTE